MAGCKEEVRMRMEGCSVVCPKPRRLDLGLFDSTFHDHHHFRPSSFRWPINNNHRTEIGDSKAGTELLDIILAKGNCSERPYCNQVASSPPFFSGSPPSRASNPVVQDEHFGNENITAFPPVAPPSPSARKVRGCAPISSGHKPAAVRIEGFDCLNSDRRNRSISAVA
ncbi:hypothetical protein I3843_15G110400 [Carya illinoinensis]|uniref:Uncharacterized protein n=1 Tax=Carya illinoinensis TaxID=32201 RepID=A0A8T1NF31_CARIL|nr:uncharacterized protein LOC122297247 [Carya illinoinensis]KAG2667422.1 hypothetical protein I3760_15G114500 [Carya illinoinensis]KAG2667423.1 hypothetical protein I3760_15G114500 [Carya illinoinensis]KAG6627473.1 hypothetical protein CIPAW_15G130700 [Carya illinoinensis]KAG6627474.1 hypothetical protein CIPAW_15G130700 [Carya illinoinensis]KAG6675694.1 hypothetical protein I3842_15G116500 [Carya illinoinensis]